MSRPVTSLCNSVRRTDHMPTGLPVFDDDIIILRPHINSSPTCPAQSFVRTASAGVDAMLHRTQKGFRMHVSSISTLGSIVICLARHTMTTDLPTQVGTDLSTIFALCGDWRLEIGERNVAPRLKLRTPDRPLEERGRAAVTPAGGQHLSNRKEEKEGKIKINLEGRNRRDRHRSIT